MADRSNAAAADSIKTHSHFLVGDCAIDPSACIASASARLSGPAAAYTLKLGFQSAVDLDTVLEVQFAADGTMEPPCCQIGTHRHLQDSRSSVAVEVHIEIYCRHRRVLLAAAMLAF